MNKATIIVLALTLTAVLTGLGYYVSNSQSTIPSAVSDLWSHWKTQNNKKYGTEDQNRLSVFYKNYQRVMNHQQNPDKTYNMGFTKFMDLTPEEFKAKYLSARVQTTQKNIKILPTTNLPTSVDWRTKGAVTPVKDQGQCGSCWAFGTTGSLESISFISGQGLQSFSEQQLVDCSTSEGNEGCNGGLHEYAFTYVESYGITTESNYPYEGVDGTCQVSGGNFKISSYTQVQAGDVDQLASAVVQQPITISVDASNWQLYSSGIFSDCDANLDHEVLLVGYTADAWIVKNSWAESWGESGYIRLARGDTCGIADDAGYPVL
jgi:C1A family cysteine protease